MRPAQGGTRPCVRRWAHRGHRRFLSYFVPALGRSIHRIALRLCPRQAGLSGEMMRDLCPRDSGQSEERPDARLARTKDRLQGRDAPVPEIAVDEGFGSAEHFCGDVQADHWVYAIRIPPTRRRPGRADTRQRII
jgi:AraC-like DNA-binding protein